MSIAMRMKQLLLTGLILVGGAALLAVLGCHQTPVAGTPPATEPAIQVAAPGKSGAELWAQACSRCHNLRSPSYFSNAEWDVVVQHMRLRANLTGEEQRTIVAFLKASH